MKGADSVGQKQVKKTDSGEKVRKLENKPVDKKKLDKLKAGIDKLIDEIDDVLEENSEEFLKSYVQRGGE